MASEAGSGADALLRPGTYRLRGCHPCGHAPETLAVRPARRARERA